MLDHVQPALVFLDIRMPGMDGIEVLRSIKQKYPELGVIIITGLNQGAIEEEALAAGATDFIGKPFTMEQLQAILMVHLPSS